MFRISKAGITEEGRIQEEETQSSTERKVEIPGSHWRLNFKCVCVHVHICVCMCVGGVCSEHGLE